MLQNQNRFNGAVLIVASILVALVLSQLAVARSADAAPLHENAPNTLLWSTLEDNWTTFDSYRTPSGNINMEATDDFNVIAAVDRIVTLGFVWGNYDAAGVYVRFYAYNPDGTPGAQQAEYHLAAGDPNFIIFDYAGSPSFDITLSPAFNASGRHFVSVQPVSEMNWSWWNADHNAPRGETVYTRSNGGAWSLSLIHISEPTRPY